MAEDEGRGLLSESAPSFFEDTRPRRFLTLLDLERLCLVSTVSNCYIDINGMSPQAHVTAAV